MVLIKFFKSHLNLKGYNINPFCPCFLSLAETKFKKNYESRILIQQWNPCIPNPSPPMAIQQLFCENQAYSPLEQYGKLITEHKLNHCFTYEFPGSNLILNIGKQALNKCHRLVLLQECIDNFEYSSFTFFITQSDSNKHHWNSFLFPLLNILDFSSHFHKADVIWKKVKTVYMNLFPTFGL